MKKIIFAICLFFISPSPYKTFADQIETFLDQNHHIQITSSNLQSQNSASSDFYTLSHSNIQSNIGYSSYQIGGFTKFSNDEKIILHFPLSEIIFPTNTYEKNISFETKIFDRIFMTADFCFTNKFLNSGIMKDSDWLSNPNTKDIYSESEAHLFDYKYQIGLMYELPGYSCQNMSGIYFIGALLQKQELSIIANNLRQYDLTQPDSLPVFISEDVITYDRFSDALFCIFKTEHFWKNYLLGKDLHTTSIVGYSPWLNIRDIDNHIIRKKLAKGYLAGNSLLFALQQQILLTKELILQYGIQYQIIDAKGLQAQTKYNDFKENVVEKIADLDERLYCENTSFYASVQFLGDDFSKFNNVYTNFSQFNIKMGIGLESDNYYFYPYFASELTMDSNGKIGLGYFQVNSKTTSIISKGVTRQIPIYYIFNFEFLNKGKLGLGMGYSFVKNDLDPQAISDAAKIGLLNAEEKVLPYPFGIIEISYPIIPNSCNLYFSDFCGRSKVILEGVDYKIVSPIRFHNLIIGLSFSI